MGARSVNSCVTASAPPPRNRRAFWRGALHLGLGLAVVVLGRLEVALRAGVRVVELLLAAGSRARRRSARPGPCRDRRRRCRRRATRWSPARPPSSPARPGRPGCATTRPVTGEKTCATRRSSKVTLPLVTIVVADRVHADRLDLRPWRRVNLLRGQPDLALRRLRRARWWPPARSGSRRRRLRRRATSAGRAQPASGSRGVHCISSVAVAASIWKMAFQ